jgi:glutamate synthase (NADPH/NADH) small chain
MSSEDSDKEKVPRDQLDEKKRKWVKVPMAHQAPENRILNFDEVMHGFTKEEAIEEAGRCMACKKRLCIKACPIHQDIHGYVTAIKEGDFDKALEVILDKNPFPASIGRVCPQFCVKPCTRSKKGDALAVAALKRAASDYGNYQPKPGPSTGKKVAIVGAGPAGLTIAYDLALWGHKVNVFEREAIKGGMLYTAIPPYRLPKDEVAKDVQRIESMGVDIKTSVNIGKDVGLDDLKKDHDAVVICVGTHAPKYMGIDGEDKEGVTHVIPFLHDLHLDKDPWVGKRVAVIGGGSSAMDAVRSAKRLGKEAWLVYRRAREQMPAQLDEVEEGEEEQITFHYLTNPAKIMGEDKVVAMECIKMKLGEPDSSGRARPIPIEGSEFKIEVDMVIEAISQQPDLTGLDGDKFKLTRWNTYDVDDGGMTSAEGFFAGGDCVNGPSTIVQALASARKASVGVHKFLTGSLPPGYEEPEEGE